MHQLYFVRHGEDWAHITKQYSFKKADYSLTPIGIIQAIQTAKYLSNKNIGNLFCSPLRRASQTARIIGAALRLPIVKLDAFREINVGVLDGCVRRPEYQRLHHHTIEKWAGGSPEARFPEGENCIELFERMKQGILKVVSNRTDKASVIVCHSGILTATIGLFCPNIDAELLAMQPCHNCSITNLIIELQDGVIKGSMLFWSSQNHLGMIASRNISGN